MNKPSFVAALLSAVIITIAVSGDGFGQKSTHPHGLSVVRPTESHLERYMRFAHPIGSARMEFPGPDSGYTFIMLPTMEVRDAGDTVIKTHAYLLDLNVGHEGNYLAPDTMKTLSDYTPFTFAFTKEHLLHSKLAPGHSHEDFRALDTTFNGTIGYGLIKQFVTTYDFRKNIITFYPMYANVDLNSEDSNTIQLPLLDDAKITYCGCPFPTLWVDAEAPPLTAGHVNLAFHRPTSQVFSTALDNKTQKIIERQAHADSISGHPGRLLGLNLAEFIVGKSSSHAENLAPRGPHREIATLPAMYHDLNVPVLGFLGTDILRTFSAIIIDPSRNKLIFVK